MNSYGKLFFSIFVVIFSVGILSFSIIRASFENITKEGSLEASRVVPIKLTIFYKDGNSEINYYKIPKVRLVSNNPFYLLKRIREYFWLTMSDQYIDKSKIALFLGDKKIAETKYFFEHGDPDAATAAAKLALDKLQYSQYLFSKAHLSNVDDNQQKIILAGLAYEEILKSNYVKNNSLDTVLTQLQTWNENQQNLKR